MKMYKIKEFNNKSNVVLKPNFDLLSSQFVFLKLLKFKING